MTLHDDYLGRLAAYSDVQDCLAWEDDAVTEYGVGEIRAPNG